MRKIAIFVLALGSLWATQAAAADTAQVSATKNVGIVNFAFKPGTLTVPKGTKVEFENESNTAHTTTSKNFDSKRIAPGKSFMVRFQQRGTFAYHCKIHPFMKGKIVVQ
ncbi:MAG: cupredoxin domain-containing protein [Thermoleophilia bacterium]|nr:cupredoxin domain-containing protein [Thermoleophilia bacterium]